MNDGDMEDDACGAWMEAGRWMDLIDNLYTEN